MSVASQSNAVRASLALLALCFAASGWAQVPPPPGETPVNVLTGFYLLNLNSVDEKAETFDASIYLRFSWHDARLKHEGKSPLVYTEDAAREKLDKIWWPEIEFVNTSTPGITNRTLEIKPDGEVILNLGLTSTFNAKLDLRRFPFDRQKLEIRVESFLCESSQLRFEVDRARLDFERSSTFEGLRVVSVGAETVTEKATGWQEKFSEYRAHIVVEHNASFYLWTVFGPVLLIFLISCTVHLVPSEQLADRVGICLTSLLACIATQFTLSFSLPQISYLTLIDRLFIATYAFIAVNVLSASVEMLLTQAGRGLRRRTKAVLAAAIPTLYLALVVALMSF